jgi:hypothetical protein
MVRFEAPASTFVPSPAQSRLLAGLSLSNNATPTAHVAYRLQPRGIVQLLVGARPQLGAPRVALHRPAACTCAGGAPL